MNANTNDKAVITLKTRNFRAMLAPDIGANLFSLVHKPTGCEVLRRPVGLDELRAHSCVYGIPVLFPPNRIAGGRFSCSGREYCFPINEKTRGNHIHGFLHNRPWQVAHQASDNIGLVFKNTPDTDFFEFLPHAFVIIMDYSLNEGGLNQRITVKNLSDEPLPFMLGLHTTFSVASADICRVALADFQWKLDDTNMLPDGSMLPMGALAAFCETGLCPETHRISTHAPVGPALHCADGRAIRGAVLERRSAGIRVLYEIGPEFTQWMLWNNAGGHGYFCIEPQTCVVNAPNMHLPAPGSGFQSLGPTQEWISVNRIGVV